jgi:nucleoside 2-deoxyribosyltransferase
MKTHLAKVYIAGFEVFRPDAAEFFAAVSKLCGKLDMQALCPFDPSVDASDPEAIYQHNMELLMQATAMVANMNTFRGSEPDSGTAWEHGFMKARGFPVVSYTGDKRSEGDKQVDYFRARNWWLSYETPLLPDKMYRTNHFSPFNLMIAKSSTKIVFGEVTDALLALRDYLLQQES